MSRCVILSAGPVEDPEALRPLLRDDDWFIAADGGMRLAERLGVTPGLIVADFDSGEAPRETRAEVLRLPAEKDWTDTMAAAMAGLERGFRDFLLLGCTGGPAGSHHSQSGGDAVYPSPGRHADDGG